jgi:5-methylcytosine-specific restriction endonuclease McrA
VEHTYGGLSGRKRALFLNLWGRKCAYCGVGLRVGKKKGGVKCTIDHIIPRKLGGDSLTNLAPACEDCNGGKADNRLTPKHERRMLAKAQEVALSFKLWTMRENPYRGLFHKLDKEENEA